MSVKYKDLEFIVDESETFKDFGSAVEKATVMSASHGGVEVQVDVLVYSKTAAKIWGGDEAMKVYEEDPESSVHERIIITAKSLGRVA